MTPEDRLKLSSEFFSKLIDAGLNLREVQEVTKLAADVMEFSVENEISLKELAASPEKLAGVFDNVTDLIKSAPAYGLGLTALGLGGAYGLGRFAGDTAGKMTDHASEDYTEELKNQELVSLLRENAATLRRRKMLQDGENSGNANY